MTPDPALINHPVYVHPEDLVKVPTASAPLAGEDLARYVARISTEIAERLKLEKQD